MKMLSETFTQPTKMEGQREEVQLQPVIETDTRDEDAEIAWVMENVLRPSVTFFGAFFAFVFLALFAGCGGSGGYGGAVLQSMTITPANMNVPLGSTQQFSASGHFSDSSTQVLVSAKWSSSAIGVATINANSGLATTITHGKITITATSGTISGGAQE